MGFNRFKELKKGYFYVPLVAKLVQKYIQSGQTLLRTNAVT
jgi:hypothetical protein